MVPASPDKPLLAGTAKEDSTGWLLEVIRQQKELMIALIEANDLRYAQRFEASKEAISAALNAAKEAIASALASQDRAVQKAEAASERRFESVNEFRNTLSDQQRTLMPRPEAEIMFKGINDKIAALEARVVESVSTRSGIGQGWGYAVGVVGFVVALISIAVAVSR